MNFFKEHQKIKEEKCDEPQIHVKVLQEYLRTFNQIMEETLYYVPLGLYNQIQNQIKENKKYLDKYCKSKEVR